MLNSVQDAINRIILSTYSLKSIVCDATGGNIVAASMAGSIKVATTAVISGTAIPSPDSGIGTIYRDSVVAGWCCENRDTLGAIVGVPRYHNVLNSVRNGVGDYTITLNYEPVDAAGMLVLITIASPTTGILGGTATIFDQTTVGSKFVVRFKTGYYGSLGAGTLPDGAAYVLADLGYRVLCIGY